MRTVLTTLFFVAAYCIILTQGNLFRQRRHDSEIKSRKGETIHGKAGIPLFFDKDTNAIIRTGIPELRKPEDVDEGMGPGATNEDEDSESGVSEKEDLDDGDDDDDDGSEDDKDKKNPEELGEGYEKIGNMGSKNKDDDDDDSESKGSQGTDSSDGDIMSEAGDSKKPVDLNADYPPTADQVDQLPKDDDELTPEQADRKLADKRKGYAQFTIRQRFKPELKYKESAAYKILAGNVAHDVERALKATGVVRDVLFREAKDIGGPPYRSKVQVFLKLKNVSDDKVKRLVDYGLINGMITVPGSFSAK